MTADTPREPGSHDDEPGSHDSGSRHEPGLHDDPGSCHEPRSHDPGPHHEPRSHDDPYRPRDPDLAEVVARELRMLRPEVRRDPAALLRDLHPEFHEVGASGRLWDRASVAAVLSPATAAPNSSGDRPSRVTAMTATRLAPDLVHLRWDTDDGDRTVHRASLWRREPGPGEWLLWFHQGTPYTVDAPDDGTP
ncbi:MULTISPECIES: DUF4440 domain-containing protein [Streptomyces]|uniref:Nuclear transport factor 2 family protein n=1 Tax=Streptomyces evansiae TaxID=3075535 RepID=A0ABU2R654_9ACTN|nr:MULTISPECIES: nuclear transport factor 2 family protein [unclassified Streptomyces]MDT0412167.1 nuclear transport factor 2 family protein [Streptomyces sp. DSM 41979]MYQ56019.1 DUF4440 domain-containing protein [Streptomyces sp. SID4926]SCD50872.1 hypothetical protein GA0115252_10815 [Streptomyces sp. DfronAA-171]